MWFLEAPSPLVLMTVFISPWLRRQQRKACVPLRAILTRLIPPASLARLVLLAILVRSVTPPLATQASLFLLHLFLLLGHSTDRCSRGVDRHVLLARP